MKSIIVMFAFFSSVAVAAPSSLENDLKELDAQDAVPGMTTSDRLYAVQQRATPLSRRTEILLSAGQTLAGSDFLDSSQVGAEIQYHFNDRFSVAGGYSKVTNKLTSSARNLENSTGFLPDVDYASSRWEARAQYNLFYGKFRFNRTQALSFDQYLGLGVANHDLLSGNVTGPVFDAGLAFWMGKKFSFHAGVKDYYYKENRMLSKGNTHNVQGYVQAGILL